MYICVSNSADKSQVLSTTIVLKKWNNFGGFWKHMKILRCNNLTNLLNWIVFPDSFF